MSLDPVDELVTLDEIGSNLKVEFPHTIGCKIDEANRQIIVGRMELSLEGKHGITAGWRGKICMVSGINREYALYDGIVLPRFVIGGKTPIGPYLVEDIPNDLIHSKDEWFLEFRIVDSCGKERTFLRSSVVHREANEFEIQLVEIRKQYEDQLEAKEKILEIRQEKLNQKTRELARQKQEIDDLQSALEAEDDKLLQEIDNLKIALKEKEKELKESSEQVINSAKEIRELKKNEKELSDERDLFKVSQQRLEQSAKDQREKVESLHKELEDKTNQLVQQQEEIETLQGEWERATRLAEDQKIRIEGLQAELDSIQSVYTQRGTKLEEETSKSRRLDREIEQLKEVTARHEKTIEQQEIAIGRLNGERDRAEAEASQLRVERNTLESKLFTQEDNTARLCETLTDTQTKLDSAQSEVTQLQLKFEKAVAGKTLYQRYELIRHIRSSNVGEMYKVYDKVLERALALQVLPSVVASDPRTLHQLTQKSQLLAKLSHITTVRFYDFVKGAEPYMVMEYVDGKTFRQIIDTHAPLPRDQVVDYLKQICKGLSYAHSQSIYHHNLSPEHLVLTDDGFVKITDFAMAATIRMTMTRMTGQVSTEMLGYLAPEQVHGNHKIDGRSDLYSLGVIFYEMLSGKLPDIEEDLIDQLSEDPQHISGIPSEIEFIIHKCLEKNLKARYQHIDEILKDLLDLNLEDKSKTSLTEYDSPRKLDG